MSTAVGTLDYPHSSRNARSVLIGGLIGGAILFVWSAISWMALPWHTMTIHTFTNDGAVTQAILANATQSGIYLLPMGETAQAQQQMASGPMVFASVRLGPMKSMGALMGTQFVLYLAGALLGAVLLSVARPMSYSRRVLFLVGIAAIVAVIGHIPMWNWFSFSAEYTVVEVADRLIGWTLAGLAIAKFVR